MVRLIKARHVKELKESFLVKQGEQEGAAVRLDSEGQFELAAVAMVRAEVYRECAAAIKLVEDHAHAR